MKKLMDKTYFTWLILGMWWLMAVACQEQVAPTLPPIPTQTPPEPTAVAQPTDTLRPTATMTPKPTAVPAATPTATAVRPTATPLETTPTTELATAEIVDVVWEWVGFTNPATGPEEIAEPDRYQITLGADGRFFMQADCNTGSGTFTLDGGGVTLTPGPLTAAACPADSLADDFVRYLSAAAIWFRDGDDLMMDLQYDSGTMRFRAATQDSATGDGVDPAVDFKAEQDVTSAEIAATHISLDLQGLAQSFAWQAVPSSSSEGVPAHILVTFGGEDAQEVLANNGRRLYIFPVERYQDLAGNVAIVEVERLQALIDEANGRANAPQNPMPLLPPPLSFMDRWVQFADLNFRQAAGVRYIADTPNRQAIGPWTNETTAYYYQGLSADGRYYVSLIWPVGTDALPNTFEEAPDDVKAQATNPATYDAYLRDTRDLLNSLSPSEWHADLRKLDAMIASLILN
jgi:heat shock protein HslJ